MKQCLPGCTLLVANGATLSLGDSEVALQMTCEGGCIEEQGLFCGLNHWGIITGNARGTSTKSFNLVNGWAECNKFLYNVISLAWAVFLVFIGGRTGSCSTDLNGEWDEYSLIPKTTFYKALDRNTLYTSVKYLWKG